MGTIWCYGDSNTYGYATPWPELLAEKTGLEVINDGKNGRMIPGREYELRQFRKDAERYDADALIVMLGTNDLLEGVEGRGSCRADGGVSRRVRRAANPVGLTSILAARGMGAGRRSRGGIAGAGAAI